MSARLRGLAATAHDVPARSHQVIGAPPAYGRPDPLSLRRLRHAIEHRLGHLTTLDAHLGLLDARGAWYAWHAVHAWDPDQGEALFGVVRHVVRTQLPGPTPQPDIEGWLTAGRPANRVLAAAWEQVLIARWPEPPRVVVRAATAPHPVDEVVAHWPARQFPGFVHAYATVEATLETHAITLPPIAR